MDWFYEIEGERLGPVNGKILKEMVESGSLTDATLVWNPDMPEWKSFKQVFAVPEYSTDETVSFPVEHKPCMECGNLFGQDELLQYGENWVCGQCKTIVFQKLKEGKVASTRFEFASFGARFGAKVVDSIILFAVFFVFQLVIMTLLATSLFQESDVESSERVVKLLFFLISTCMFIGPLLYNTLFVGKFGATPGKMLIKSKVVTPDGKKISYSRAAGRYLAELLSSSIFCIGYLIAGTDEELRTLHDRIVNTRVIRIA